MPRCTDLSHVLEEDLMKQNSFACRLGSAFFLALLGSWAYGQTEDEGQRLFEQHCADCHAPTAQAINDSLNQPKTLPPDLSKIAERRDGVWPILEVMSIIDGYTKATNPREDMPIIKSMSDGPFVEFDTGNGQEVLVPRRLLALAIYLESIQSPRPNRYVP